MRLLPCMQLVELDSSIASLAPRLATCRPEERSIYETTLVVQQVRRQQHTCAGALVHNMLCSWPCRHQSRLPALCTMPAYPLHRVPPRTPST